MARVSFDFSLQHMNPWPGRLTLERNEKAKATALILDDITNGLQGTGSSEHLETLTFV